MGRLGLLFLVVALLGFSSSCDSNSRDDASLATAETVHPCDPAAPDPFGVQSAQLGGTPSSAGGAAATPVIQGGASVRGDFASLPGCTGPDFSQRCPLWGGLEYDHGSGQDVGCGSTIAQCGCAMTAAASLLRHYGVDRGPSGQPTNPMTLNDWFKQDARQTRDGVVSQGYVYGGVNWLAVATYSKLAAQSFNTPSVVYNGSIQRDLSALKNELGDSRPVILEQPGHFILATSANSGKVTIADPFYADRTALDSPAYRDSFISGRRYRPGSDMSAVLVAAPSRVRIAVSQGGAVTGYRSGQQQPVSEVRQSQFALEGAWRDPTCTAAPPQDDKGVGMATLLLPAAAKYGIEVEGAPNSSFSFAVYAYDQAGGTVLRQFEGNLPASGKVHYDMDYNPAPGSPQPVTQSSEPQPVATAPTTPATPSPTPPPGASPSPSRTPTPRATATITPTPTATPGPAANIVLQVFPSDFTCENDSAITVVAFPTDAAGKIPGPTTIDFSTSRGSVSPPSSTTSIGRAEVAVFPGKNPTSAPVVITITATVRGTGISASFNVTCRSPIIIL